MAGGEGGVFIDKLLADDFGVNFFRIGTGDLKEYSNQLNQYGHSTRGFELNEEDQVIAMYIS